MTIRRVSDFIFPFALRMTGWVPEGDHVTISLLNMCIIIRGGGGHCIEAALWAAKLKVKGQNTYSQASKYLIMVVLSKLSPNIIKLTKIGKLIV